ncbi:MAG: phenylacetate--CoA ligase family protein, partial [Candidatus Contendobacter sp.]|nr:phenylacetate--CoA ligase family protein [Candidatus Contendobacter sp.]
QCMDDLGIAVAFVTSERLYDDQREIIARIFGCRVANGYGARDAGFIAHECPSGGMHLSAEDIVVELIDQDGRPVQAGEAGEIVVTHLATRDFPLVRYRTGDIAV